MAKGKMEIDIYKFIKDQIDGLKSDQRKQITELKEGHLDPILIQGKITNGRVTSLEKFRNVGAGVLLAFSLIIGYPKLAALFLTLVSQ